ncbi:MAG: LysM domain-containing protein, partial [bacterium]|nr:LysM domain-containing protein [bacterium]
MPQVGWTDPMETQEKRLRIPQNAPVALNRDGTVRPGERTHTVVEGDTLLGIALQYGKTLDEITEANNIVAAELIQIGQQLIIPPEEEQAAP